MEIGTEWITIAVELNGKLTVGKNLEGSMLATMTFHNGRVVRGKPNYVLLAALDSLDTALADDAAKEMIENGSV